jgi:hypothetical protein
MEDNIIKIKYLNKDEEIIKFWNESNNRLKQRLNFISKLEKLNKEFKETYKLSKLWYNIKFNKCRYSQDIYKLIITLDKL